MKYLDIARANHSFPVPRRTLPRLKSRVLILGVGPLGRDLHRVLTLKWTRRYEVVGFLDSKLTKFENGAEWDADVLGSYDQLGELVWQYEVETVLVCTEDRRSVLPVNTLLGLKAAGIEIIDGYRFYEDQCGRVSIDSLRPSALIFSKGFRHGYFTKLLKRSIDLVVACLGLIISSPLLLLIAILIKLDSSGPVFYRQMRIGLRGQPYMITKFRSMREDAEMNGPVWAVENDPRVSRVGRILRKWRLDELPQLWNVLRGEMSLVGPRPERPVFVQQLNEQIPYYDIRHTVKPGLTGWAQVRFRYGASTTDAHTKLQYDLYYVKNISVLLDLKILLRTVRVVLLGEGSQ